jgi:hypothetical protein
VAERRLRGDRSPAAMSQGKAGAAEALSRAEGNGRQLEMRIDVSENAHVAQSAEHFLGKEEVMGPIPIVGFAQ